MAHRPCRELRELRPVENGHRVRYDEECPGAFLSHRGEGGIEFIGTPGFEDQNLKSQRPGCDLQHFYRDGIARIGGVRGIATRRTAGGLPEQLQTLTHDRFQADAVGNPVTFPPGRAKLAMSPRRTGSPRWL